MKLRAGALAMLLPMSLAFLACEPPPPPPTDIPPIEQPPPPGLPNGVPLAATRAEPVLPTPAGWPFPDEFPRTSGTARLAGGALEWTDFLYDDHGAQGVPVNPGGGDLAPPTGTYLYPDGAARRNGADIFRVGIGLNGTSTYWRIDWNTLDDPDVPIAAFALDTDGSAATGVAAWGAGTGLQSAGIERVLVVSSRGVWVINAATGLRTALGAAAVTVDHNPARAMGSFVAKVPTSALPGRSQPWTVRVAAGLATANGADFAPVPPERGALPGQPAVYNVSFRGVHQEPPGMNFWMENEQAAALATGDVSPFSVAVNWAGLAARQSTGEPFVTGYSNRWFASSLELGKGVVTNSGDNPAGDLRPNYLGRVQPYAVYLPTTLSPGAETPLTWLLHSLGVQHNQYGALNPKFLQQACEARRTICATTLGRGPDGWYFDEAEVDFWEVWHALGASFTLDPERTVLAGYSMGGRATYKLGLAYPDLFAQAGVLAGPPVCGIRGTGGVVAPAGPGRCTHDGTSVPLLGNARWLPYYIGHGALDQLVPVSGVVEQVADFDELGYRHRFELFPTQDHLAWVIEDLFASPAASLGNLSRKQNPGRITYTWFPHLTRADLGIGPTGAYWVRGLYARNHGAGLLASVDIASAARPDRPVTPVRTSGPLVTTDTPPLVGTFSELAWQLGSAPAAHPTITATLTNVSVLSFQLGRAGIGPGQDATIAVTSDGSATLGLTGLAPGQSVSVGATTVHASGSGRAAIGVPAGNSTITLG